MKEIDSKQLDASIWKIHANLKNSASSGKMIEEEAKHSMAILYIYHCKHIRGVRREEAREFHPRVEMVLAEHVGTLFLFM